MNIEVKNSLKPIDYDKSMKVLEERANDVFLGKKDELLWIVEHNSVYTAGTSSNKTDLLDKRIKIIKTNRGGKYTYHGPGQKVVYFVLNLNKRGKDIRKLINKIENCIIEILKEYKIKSYADKKNIGIWRHARTWGCIPKNAPSNRRKMFGGKPGWCFNCWNSFNPYK